MANVKICDRCGKHHADNFWKRHFSISKVWTTLSLGDLVTYRTYDLCPECNKKLDKFLKGAEIDEGSLK